MGKFGLAWEWDIQREEEEEEEEEESVRFGSGIRAVVFRFGNWQIGRVSWEGEVKLKVKVVGGGSFTGLFWGDEYWLAINVV